MSKVINFPSPKEEEDDNRVNELIDSLKENLEELVFVKIESSGQVSVGHTPLSKAGAAIIFYQIQSYMQMLLSQPDEEETYH